MAMATLKTSQVLETCEVCLREMIEKPDSLLYHPK
jgi:hypothetical protein